jgi:hypothetical protein
MWSLGAFTIYRFKGVFGSVYRGSVHHIAEHVATVYCGLSAPWLLRRGENWMAQLTGWWEIGKPGYGGRGGG